MHHRISVAVLAVLAVSVPAAAEDWSQTFAVKGTPEVVLKLNDGHIKVVGWNRPEVQAAVIATGYDRSDYEVRPRQSGDRVEIEVKKFPEADHGLRGLGRNRRFALEVSMPAKGNLEARTDDGHLELSGLAGKIQAHTGDGHISARDLEGSVELRTGDGHISAGAVRGSLVARTGDGHISVNGRFDDLELETQDGHVSAGVEKGSAMRSNWHLRTGDGQVNVSLPSGFSAELDASTGDGKVRVSWEGVDEPRPGEERSSFRGKIGGGGRLLTVRSGDGDIRIGR